MDDLIVPDSSVGDDGVPAANRAVCDLRPSASKSAPAIFTHGRGDRVRAVREPSAVSLYGVVPRKRRISPSSVAYAAGALESVACGRPGAD